MSSPHESFLQVRALLRKVFKSQTIFYSVLWGKFCAIKYHSASIINDTRLPIEASYIA